MQSKKSNPIIESADGNSAQIAWATNRPFSSRVWYGTDPNNLTQLAESLYATGTTHRVRLKNLQPNTTYYFRVETGQAVGTGGAAVEGNRVMSFKTTAPGAPPLTNQQPQ